MVSWCRGVSLPPCLPASVSLRLCIAGCGLFNIDGEKTFNIRVARAELVLYLSRTCLASEDKFGWLEYVSCNCASRRLGYFLRLLPQPFADTAHTQHSVASRLQRLGYFSRFLPQPPPDEGTEPPRPPNLPREALCHPNLPQAVESISDEGNARPHPAPTTPII